VIIERTEDEVFITNCITNPFNWDACSDDGCGDPGLFFLQPDKNVMWVKVEDYGVFMLTAHNHILFECHTLLLPHAHGKAVAIGKEALEWAFEYTPAERIITSVPEYNVLALRLAHRVGFVQYGLNFKAWKKNGKLHDLIMLGATKEGV
jgi:RimJ/RimL family protein N-acetyltransferase